MYQQLYMPNEEKLGLLYNLQNSYLLVKVLKLEWK